jgi:hypothetical protein
LRQVEQVVHHLGELGRRPIDELHLFLMLVGERTIHELEQDARQAANRAERGPNRGSCRSRKRLSDPSFAQLIALIVELGVERHDPAVGLGELRRQRRRSPPRARESRFRPLPEARGSARS